MSTDPYVKDLINSKIENMDSFLNGANRLRTRFLSNDVDLQTIDNIAHQLRQALQEADRLSGILYLKFISEQ